MGSLDKRKQNLFDAISSYSRLILLFAFYAFVFLLLFAYFVICRVNAYFSRRLALFVALVAIPPLISTLTLSNFDPVFSEFAGSALRWGCFAVIVIVVIAITLLQVYRSADLPKRKRDDLEKDRSIN